MWVEQHIVTHSMKDTSNALSDSSKCNINIQQTDSGDSKAEEGSERELGEEKMSRLWLQWGWRWWVSTTDAVNPAMSQIISVPCSRWKGWCAEKGSQREVNVPWVTTRITTPVKAHPIGLIGIRDLWTEVRLEVVWSHLVGTKMGLQGSRSLSQLELEIRDSNNLIVIYKMGNRNPTHFNRCTFKHRKNTEEIKPVKCYLAAEAPSAPPHPLMYT